MATWFVDASVPASGDGTTIGTAFKTLTEAANVAMASDIIAVEPGVYREVYEPPFETQTIGNNLDRFVISGGEALPGLTACTIADEPVAGPNWAEMFKATVALSLFPDSDVLSANLCEDGVQMPLSSERADRSDDFFISYSEYWWTAEAVDLSGENVTGFQLKSMTDNYTAAQLEGAQISFVSEPNVSNTTDLTFDGDFLRPVGGPYVYENNTQKDNFALFNLPAAARPGEWGYVLNGANVTIYVRPKVRANATGGLIEYAARDLGLHVTNADDVKVTNFVVRQQGCPSKTRCPITLSNSDRVELSYFTCSDTLSPSSSGYAQIFSRGGDDPHLHHFTLERAQGMFGIFMSGTGATTANWPWLEVADAQNLPADKGGYPITVTGATSGATMTATGYSGIRDELAFEPSSYDHDTAGTKFVDGENLLNASAGNAVIGVLNLGASDTNNRADCAAVVYDSGGSIHDFDISFCSSSPLRIYTWQNLAVYRGKMSDCGLASHANTANAYEQCYNILFWGLNCDGAAGYFTWQESDNLVIAFCSFSASNSSSGGQRAIAEQQNNNARYPGDVFGQLGSMVLNCRTVPEPARVTDSRYGNGMKVTSGLAWNNKWRVYNNFYQGHNGEGFGADQIEAWDWNFNMQATGIGAGTYGANDVQGDWVDNYTDAENGDFTLKPGAPVRSAPGFNWTSLISGIAARFPQVPAEAFGYDLFGNPIGSINFQGPTSDFDADYGQAAPAPGGPIIAGRTIQYQVTVQ